MIDLSNDCRYKAAELSHDGCVHRAEFKSFLQHLVYFANSWDKFEELAEEHGQQLSLQDFLRGAALVGVPVGKSAAVKAFNLMDAREAGVVLFDEFCGWCARRHIGELPPDGA